MRRGIFKACCCSGETEVGDDCLIRGAVGSDIVVDNDDVDDVFGVTGAFKAGARCARV